MDITFKGFVPDLIADDGACMRHAWLNLVHAHGSTTHEEPCKACMRHVKCL